MSPSSRRRSPRLGAVMRLIATSLVLLLSVSGCATKSSTSDAGKQPALPASARIVRTAEITFPPVALPSSKRPDAGQRSVVFLDASTGFLAGGGQPIGTSSGGIYQPESAGIERTDDGGQTWTTAWGAPGAFVSWIGFESPTVGFAAGTQFDTSSNTASTGQPLWLRSSDAGVTWTAITPRIPASIAADWRSMQFAFGNAAIGIGARDPNAQMPDSGAVMIRTVDGGQDWSPVSLQNWTPTGGLTFLSPGQAFASGYGPATAGSIGGGQL